MKIAIVYYSLNGNSRFAAGKMAEAFEGHQVELIEIHPVKSYPTKGFVKFFWGGKSAMMKECPELEPYSFNAGDYDAVIIGGPVWASRFAPPVRSFVKIHGAEIRNMKLALFFSRTGSGEKSAIKRLREALGLSEETHVPSLVLTDPLDKPDVKNEERIKGFCKRLEKEWDK